MSEIGEGTEQTTETTGSATTPETAIGDVTSSKEGLVLTDQQKELIGKALGEVDGVYEGAGRIAIANDRFEEGAHSALQGVRHFPSDASPREVGYRQVTDLFESVGARMRSALIQLDETVDRSRLSDTLRVEIEGELAQAALLEGELAQQHGEEASRQFEQLATRVDKTSEGLNQLRRACLRQATENQEESSSVARRLPSELSQGYARASRRLAETANELNRPAKREEDEENETNITRKARFNRVVEELIVSVPGKKAPITNTQP